MPPPVLEFSEAAGARAARFFRDSAGGAFQISLNELPGRVHNTWPNAANESLAFTAQDERGRALVPRWASKAARTGESGTRRWVRYELDLGTPTARIGHFVLGSTREERSIDAKLLQRPLTALRPPRLYRTAPYLELLKHLDSLPPKERRRHLAPLRGTPAELRTRLGNTFPPPRGDGETWTTTVRRTTLDAKHTLTLELSVDAREVAPKFAGGHILLRSLSGRPLRLTVAAFTDAPALPPLPLEKIFTRGFLRRGGSARDLRGAELLFTGEKLLAGLKNYGTYFGRDTLMTALMMEDILHPRLLEGILTGVLRKLSPEGRVSHEESVGRQAAFENVEEYNELLRTHRRLGQTANQEILGKARVLLDELHKTREFYGMVDDDFILPVLLARFLGTWDAPRVRKKAFLKSAGKDAVAANLRFIAGLAKPYADKPRVSRLIGFPPVKSRTAARRWASRGWRDSAFGYAGGRYPMDVNAVWVPRALEAAGEITPLLDARDLPDAAEFDRMAAVWDGAAAHFRVNLDAAQARERLQAHLDFMPPGERAYWKARTEDAPAAFDALALDGNGKPIPVLCTDAAARLLFEDFSRRPDEAAALLRPVLTPYPAGLFVERVGVLAANDAYASPSVWKSFLADPYHSPKTVWGREMNLLLLGLCRQLRLPRRAGGAAALETALARLYDAAQASGLRHNELWTYRIEGDILRPARYGGTCDIQLWNLASLAVDHALERVREKQAA